MRLSSGSPARSFHHDERPAVFGDSVVVDLDGVPALDCRRGPCLRDESGPGFLTLSMLRVDELDGNSRPEARVPALPDRAHPATTNEVDHLVLSSHEAANGGEEALIDTAPSH